VNASIVLFFNAYSSFYVIEELALNSRIRTRIIVAVDSVFIFEYIVEFVSVNVKSAVEI
jgi:hypothetical protein